MSMKKLQTSKQQELKEQFISKIWDEGWAYIKTIVDVVREPVLILDKNLRVMTANDAFYRMFQVEPKVTEGTIIYELGNGQWDIPALRKLLENVLPNNTFFKGFEVTHDFPYIGRKIMILNAREIHARSATEDGPSVSFFPPIIMLAIEDITDIMLVAQTVAEHTKNLESRYIKRTRLLEAQIGKLQKEIGNLKTRLV
jgi:two-component system, chemotaxis family, CheB/CheR fusion protein